MMLIVFLLIQINKISLINATVAPTHLFVTRVGPCLGSPSKMVTITEMRIARKLYDFSVSGTLNITRDIQNGWSVKATMEKCQDIRNLDTCDFFRSFPVIKSGCLQEESQDQDVYNMFFHYSSPRLTCPLKAGVYSIKSYPFFMEDNYLTVSESKISTSVFGYTFKLEGFDIDEEKIVCADANLQLVYIREHNWMNVDYADNVTPQTQSREDYDSNGN